MMRLIHKDGIEVQLLQQVDRIRDSNETFGIKVDFLVVACAHFAEAGEVGSKLVQQSNQRDSDQDLRESQNRRCSIVP